MNDQQQTDPTVTAEEPRPSAALVSRAPGPVIDGESTDVAVEALPAQRPRRRIWPLVLAAVVVVALAAVGWWMLAPPTIDVAVPVRGPAVEAVYATGSVEAPVTIAVAPRVTGRIAEILVDEGAEVTKGQLLVHFEDDDALESVRQQAALEVFAKQEFDRVATLLEKGTSSRSAYDRAQSDWLAAKAATARLTAEANFLRLTAPTDGRVVKRDGEVGQLIPANQAVLWLTRNDPLRISSAIDEEDIARVAVGQPVLVRADAFPGQVFHGRLQAITPMGDSVARSYRVRIEMTEHTPLLIGMTVETNVIIREDHDALLVPTTAVDNGRVWQVIDGKLTATPVKIGVKGADRTEILDGLPGDATIVVKPAASFADGERVRVRTVTAK